MSLTDHFRRIATDPPNPDEPFLIELGQALRARLRRMGLLDQPPEFVGYPEYPTWDAALPRHDPFAEPILDCYIEAIANRIGSLLEHLERKPNIDGLIWLNVERFVLTRQKKSDPVGYATFKNLQAALEGLAENRQLSVENRVRGKIRNASEVRFSPGSGQLAGPVEIEAALRDPIWDPILPRLTKLGKGAQERLAVGLAALPIVGVGRFRVADLIGPLKVRVRAAHDARNRLSGDDAVAVTTADGAIAEIIRIVRPSVGYGEAAERLTRLMDRVATAIDASDAQERTRIGMSRLFEEVCRLARADEDMPGWAELARQMGASRSTFWDHLKRLQTLARRELERP